MKKENESTVNGFPKSNDVWGFTESTFARPLDEGTYKGEQVKPFKVIKTKDATREVNGKHSIDVKFTNVLDGNQVFVRSAIVEQLRFKHDTSVQAGKTTSPFSVPSSEKGIDMLNSELRFISDGKNLDVI